MLVVSTAQMNYTVLQEDNIKFVIFLLLFFKDF